MGREEWVGNRLGGGRWGEGVIECIPGVWTSFSRHSPDWRVVKNLSTEFSLATCQKTTQDGSGEEESVRGERNTRQAGKWVFIFTRQARIPLTFGEWLSAHLCIVFG
jgi:hypothetical protein